MTTILCGKPDGTRRPAGGVLAWSWRRRAVRGGADAHRRRRLQRALNECDAGKQGEGPRARPSSRRRRSSCKREREDLDRPREELRRSALVLLKEDERRNREKELENRDARVQAEVRGLPARSEAHRRRADVRHRRGALRGRERLRASSRATRWCSKSSGGLLYADKALDITDEIVKLHNCGAEAPASRQAPASRGAEGVGGPSTATLATRARRAFPYPLVDRVLEVEPGVRARRRRSS